MISALPITYFVILHRKLLVTFNQLIINDLITEEELNQITIPCVNIKRITIFRGEFYQIKRVNLSGILKILQNQYCCQQIAGILLFLKGTTRRVFFKHSPQSLSIYLHIL